MSTTPWVTLSCDHLGCEEALDGRDPGTVRRHARRLGWLVARKKRGRFHDFCPEHRDNRSFYG